jgi:apolipoprotein N-acyltransferase
VRSIVPVLRRHAVVLALLAGAAHSLCFAPFGWRPLGVLGVAALWWLWDGERGRRAALIGFAWGGGLFLSGTYWLYTSIHVIGHAPLALAFFLMLGLVAIMGSYTALLGALEGRFLPRFGAFRHLVALPAAWVLMEWIRGWFLSGFPWLALGYSALDTPFAAYAPLVGVYGLSALLAVGAGALIELCRPGRPRRVAAGLLIVLVAGGASLARVDWVRSTGRTIDVAVVQGAIPQDEKWQHDNRAHTLEVYRSLTDRALGARLIVWPEASLPLLYHEAVPYLSAIYAEASAAHSDLLLGLLHYEVSTGGYRNGLVALGPNEAWYDKRRLVPFGEFFPVPPMIRSWMKLGGLDYVDLEPGPAVQAPLEAAGEKIGATICYEDAYAADQLAVLGQATLLVNVSNDAWFGDSTAPHQHLEITRMRALEAGRWLVRSTNNGVSALIDPHGRVVAQIPQFVPDVLRGTVQALTGLTPYARTGNLPLLILAALGVLVGVIHRRRVPDA